MKTYPRSSAPPYNPRVLLAEGRQPVTFGGRSGMRRLLSRSRQPRHREAPGNRPTLLRGSAGSPGCTRRGGRKAEAFRIRWGQCPPSAHGRAVPGPEGRTPRWSAERRGILRKDAAAFPARGRGSWCAFRRSAPSLCLLGERDEGVPGAFQTIRAIPYGCLT